MNMKGIQSMQASRAMKGVQSMAKGVGDAFTGGRDLHQLLHALHSTVVAVEAYFAQPCFARVLPVDLRSWANSLCGEAREAHGRLSLRIDRMEKDGVRGAAESTLHAMSSAAGAITGIAMLDVGRHIADELLQMTGALNDILSRATRLVTLTNAMMMERLALKCGIEAAQMPVAEEVSPQLTRFEVENVHPRLWVHQVEDGCIVAGDKMQVSWETIGNVPLVNVRLKNCMGVETSRGKTVQRLTKEEGETNISPVETTIPLDFVPGKYTVAVSDPANNIRGMTFVSILRPISVADITDPPTGLGRSLVGGWRTPTWNRGTPHRICWKMHRGKSQVIVVSLAIATSTEGPWRMLRGASELKFRAPDFKPPPGSTPSQTIPVSFDNQVNQASEGAKTWMPSEDPATPQWCEKSPDASPASAVREASAMPEAGAASEEDVPVEWGQPAAEARAAPAGGPDQEWYGEDNNGNAAAVPSMVSSAGAALSGAFWGGWKMP
ncbi:hypothetical protein T484DRAFT_1933209, partial [Baffinella frigidus]